MPVLRFLSLVMATMFVFGGLSTSPLAKPNWPKSPTGKPVVATPTMKTRQIPKTLAIGSLVALRGSSVLANSTQTSNQLWEREGIHHQPYFGQPKVLFGSPIAKYTVRRCRNEYLGGSALSYMIIPYTLGWIFQQLLDDKPKQFALRTGETIELYERERNYAIYLDQNTRNVYVNVNPSEDGLFDFKQPIELRPDVCDILHDLDKYQVKPPRDKDPGLSPDNFLLPQAAQLHAPGIPETEL